MQFAFALTFRCAAPTWNGTVRQFPWHAAVVQLFVASPAVCCVCGLWQVPHLPPCGSLAGSKSGSAFFMSWQPKHWDRPGTSVPRAESVVARAGTWAVN
jgi:hypothetical protein